MPKDYNHKEIEKKWQQRWAEQKLYEVQDTVEGKENHYVLVEFPYPSGDLHVGHWDAFAVPDIYARMKRMQGYNVLYPIGFDAFGLPAENAAIKNGADPAEWTQQNIDRMRGQLKQMGNMFDWSREIAACDPAMYKWTQWLFLQLFQKELAYKKKGTVNWCPKDQTVLANEQLVNGRCERCDTPVEKKELEQWFLKITEYADRLIDDLDTLDWPNSIKEAQKSWIGRSEGAELEFSISETDKKIKVFTTRPDTLFGATYMVLAPEHELIQELAPELENKNEVDAYIKSAISKSELERQENKEKTGVQLKGVMAINPATKEEIPIFVADYVLAGYGTGAIMAVPGHDERDFEFAKKFDLPIKQVVAPKFIDAKNPPVEGKEEVERDGAISVIYDPKADKYLCLKWKHEPWTTFVTGGIEEGEDAVESARREILEETGYENIDFIAELSCSQSRFYASHKDINRIANHTVLFFELKTDEKVAVADEEKAKHEVVWLSVEEIESTDMRHAEFTSFWPAIKERKLCPYDGVGILRESKAFSGMDSEEAKEKITEFVGGKMTKTYRQRDWLISRQRYWGTPIPVVYDPEGNAHAVPDEQLPWLLPTDVDFALTGKSPLATSKELIERTEKIFGEGWRPEVDTMDTFMDSSWYFLRYLDPKNENEFASKEKQKSWMPVDMYSGGAEHTTMHILYSRFFYKVLYDLGLVTESEPYKVRMNRGLILAEDGRKMSKRWGNTVNPDEQVVNVGADSVKMYLAFIGPYNEVGSYPWSTNGLVGVRRFLERVLALHEKVVDFAPEKELETLTHQTIKKVEEDVQSMKFNTSVSALMIMSNELQKLEKIPKETYAIFLRLLAPFAPHLAEELWEKQGNTTSIHLEPWPKFDPEKLVSDRVVVAVQIAGKVRGTVEAARGASQEDVLEIVRGDSKLEKYLDFKPQKVIFVPDRVINLIP